MRRYLVLLGATLIVALLLPGAARLLRARPAAPPPAPLAEAALALSIADGTVTPERSAVPKDRRVRLTIVNRGATPVTVALAGYEDRLPAAAIAAGGRREWTFVSDLPGEDFAWLIDGRPVGVLSVTGSHLVEGHR